MTIDVDNVLSTFVVAAQDTIGSQLSLVGPSGNQEPAVILVRQNGTKPDMPFVTVDCLSITDSNEWLLQSYLSASNELVYETNKDMLIQYRVYGGNAIQIANNLHGYFRVGNTLDFIRNNTGGAVTFVDTVNSLPQLLSDEFVESASINITMAITDALVIPDTGSNYFDSVNLDGELRNNIQDPPGLDLNVTAP
jgi:hypothetical protein